MFGAILQYRRVWRQTLRFGAKPYELVFAWRYTLRTRIHLALYCNTPYGPYPTLLAPAAETVSRYIPGFSIGARLRAAQRPAKNYCRYPTAGARVYKGKRQLPRLSRHTYQAVPLAPDSVRTSAQPKNAGDTRQPAPVFIKASASCRDCLDIRTRLYHWRPTPYGPAPSQKMLEIPDSGRPCL